MKKAHRRSQSPIVYWCVRSVIVSIFATGLPVQATMVTILPNRDTAIFAENPDNNFGNGNLIAGTNAHDNSTARSLLEFDVASMIPVGSVINSVTFQIGVVRQSNQAQSSSYELHRLLTDWSEGVGGVAVNTGSPALSGETTWNSRLHGSALWNLPGGQSGSDYAAVSSGVGPVISSADSIYEIGTTPGFVSDVQGWLDAPAANFGWILLGSSEGVAGTARRFSSTEVPGSGIASALIPRILVDYTVVAVPEVGMGLAGILVTGFGVVEVLARCRRRASVIG